MRVMKGVEWKASASDGFVTLKLRVPGSKFEPVEVEFTADDATKVGADLMVLAMKARGALDAEPTRQRSSS